MLISNANSENSLHEEETDSLNKNDLYPELDCDFTEEEVLNDVRKLKADKSSGSDNMLNEFFKTFSSEMVSILTVFNKIIYSGEFPIEWRKSIIISIFKKGDNNDVNNYRGI